MEDRCYPVELQDRCDVVERGEALQVWFVEHNDGWTRACEHPAKVEDDVEDAPDRVPPGTVWVRRTELRLPKGTAVWRVKTWPRPTTETDAERILEQGVRGVKRVRQDVYYRVRGTYAVVADKERNSRRPVKSQYRPPSERAAMVKREGAALGQRRRDQLARLARLAETFSEIGGERSTFAAVIDLQGTPPIRRSDMQGGFRKEARRQREALVAWAEGEGFKKASGDG